MGILLTTTGLPLLTAGGLVALPYVEPPDETVLAFGALTLAGAGGAAKPEGATSITGGTATGYTLSGGLVAPTSDGSADAGTLIFDDATEWTVSVEAGGYSCRTQAEMLSAYAAMDLGGGTIRMRAGADTSSSGRATLSARVFTGECVITSDGFDIDANPAMMGDPRAVTRSAKIGGLDFPAGSQNVRVTGLKIFATTGSAVVYLTAPTDNVSIVQNEIHSSPIEGRWLAGLARFNDSGDPAYQQHWAFFADPNHPNEIMSTLYCHYGADGPSDVHRRLRANYNYAHDVAAGFGMRDCAKNEGGERSQCIGNYVLDSMNNFSSTGRKCNGLDIFDNRGMHVWTASKDTQTYDIPGTRPHSATGVSWSSKNGVITKDVRIFGNIFHVGWHRTKLHRDNGIEDPLLAATGMKLNDPESSYAYQDIVIGFNLIVPGNGIGIEITGGDNNDVFHNTILSDQFTEADSGASIYFQGAKNSRAWNNITNVFATGSNDGGTEDGVALDATLDTYAGYGNISVGATSMVRYFEGRGGVLWGDLTIDEVETAFVPKATTWARQGAQKHGALGTGKYLGLGAHTADYDPPAPASGGTGRSVPTTVWDGATHLLKTGGLQHGGSAMPDSPHFTMLWEGQVHSDVDGSTVGIFGAQFNRLYLSRWAGGTLYAEAQDASAAVLSARGGSIGKVNSADGVVRVAATISGGYMHGAIAINGVLTDFPGGLITRAEGNIDISVGSYRINADRIGNGDLKGSFRGFLLMNEWLDLESDEGLSAIFTGSGEFRDWGSDGSSITPSGQPAAICIYGDAASINGGTGNKGDGGSFAVSGGTVTDA